MSNRFVPIQYIPCFSEKVHQVVASKIFSRGMKGKCREIEEEEREEEFPEARGWSDRLRIEKQKPRGELTGEEPRVQGVFWESVSSLSPAWFLCGEEKRRGFSSVLQKDYSTNQQNLQAEDGEQN